MQICLCSKSFSSLYFTLLFFAKRRKYRRAASAMTLPAATGSRATTLAILALAGVTLDTRLRYGNDAADPHRQLSEPDDQSGALVAHLEGEVGQLKGMLGAAQSTIGGMEKKIAQLEAFFEPLVMHEPAQSPSGAGGAMDPTDDPSGKAPKAADQRLHRERRQVRRIQPGTGLPARPGDPPCSIDTAGGSY